MHVLEIHSSWLMLAEYLLRRNHSKPISHSDVVFIILHSVFREHCLVLTHNPEVRKRKRVLERIDIHPKVFELINNIKEFLFKRKILKLLLYILCKYCIVKLL